MHQEGWETKLDGEEIIDLISFSYLEETCIAARLVPCEWLAGLIR
jgi:hypothetical protein